MHSLLDAAAVVVNILFPVACLAQAFLTLAAPFARRKRR